MQIDIPQTITRPTSAQGVTSELPPVARADGRVAGHGAAKAPPAAYLAQVINVLSDKALVELKVLQTHQQLHLQTASKLTPGQIVLLQPEGDSIVLISNPREAANQLRRLLLPFSGSMQDSFLQLARQVLNQGQGTTAPGRSPSGSPTGPPNSNLAPATAAQVTANSRLQAGGNVATATPAGGELKFPQTPIQNTTRQASTAGLSSSVEATVSRHLPAWLAPIINSLPSRSEVTHAAGLRQAFEQTGLIHLGGSSAANASPGLTQLALNPLGKLLLPLLHQLVNQSQTSGDVIPRLTDLLARALLSQLGNFLNTEAPDADQRRGEILVRHEQQIEGFQLQFNAPKPIVRREAETDEQFALRRRREKRWTVRLNFEFEETGKVTALVALNANQHVELCFWSDRPDTCSLLHRTRAQFEERFKQRLKQEGIELDRIEVFEGDAPASQPGVSSHLIDETA